MIVADYTALDIKYDAICIYPASLIYLEPEMSLVELVADILVVFESFFQLLLKLFEFLF